MLSRGKMLNIIAYFIMEIECYETFHYKVWLKKLL